MALLATVYAATFVVAVLLHVGGGIPLGFVVLDEPRPFAVIVEGVAGVVLAVGAFAVFAGTTRAWAAAAPNPEGSGAASQPGQSTPSRGSGRRSESNPGAAGQPPDLLGR